MWGPLGVSFGVCRLVPGVCIYSTWFLVGIERPPPVLLIWGWRGSCTFYQPITVCFHRFSDPGVLGSPQLWAVGRNTGVAMRFLADGRSYGKAEEGPASSEGCCAGDKNTLSVPPCSSFKGNRVGWFLQEGGGVPRPPRSSCVGRGAGAGVRIYHRPPLGAYIVCAPLGGVVPSSLAGWVVRYLRRR